MQMEKEDRQMRRVMRISIGTVTQVFIKSAEKEERKQKGGYEFRTEHKTRSKCNTCRKTGKEESIHTRHKLLETGKQTKECAVRETEAIIGKAPGLGIHTTPSPLTGGKVAKPNKFSSAYQLANIQIFCTG